jgi:hypothetical protein
MMRVYLPAAAARRIGFAVRRSACSGHRMKHLALAVALFSLAACATAPAVAQSAACLPAAGYDRAGLDALKAAEWALPDDARRNALARALTACLGSPDPTLRDGIVFEGLQHWLRAKQLAPETMRALAADLEAQLTAADPQGFRQPFAALVLSEVARADRVEPYLDSASRQRLLDASIGYFSQVRDYRGFDEREGWRHGVAHGADLMLQLSLNPALGKADLERISAAIAAQVAPNEHFYIYGEPERLARPIIFMSQRGLISEAEWTRWLAQFPTAGENMFASQAGLARRHNVNAFLYSVWLNAKLSESAADDVLLPGAEAAIRVMP